MYMPNPPGFHSNLTTEVKNKIIGFVEDALVVSTISKVARVPYTTLRRWLKKGEEEAKTGEWNIYVQLWIELEDKRGQEIIKITKDVKDRAKNWQASWELLRAMCREDFGVEASEYQELLVLYAKLSNDLESLRANRTMSPGGINNVGKMDISSDQAPRRIEERAACKEGQEDTSQKT